MALWLLDLFILVRLALRLLVYGFSNYGLIVTFFYEHLRNSRRRWQRKKPAVVFGYRLDVRLRIPNVGKVGVFREM